MTSRSDACSRHSASRARNSSQSRLGLLASWLGSPCAFNRVDAVSEVPSSGRVPDQRRGGCVLDGGRRGEGGSARVRYSTLARERCSRLCLPLMTPGTSDGWTLIFSPASYPGNLLNGSTTARRSGATWK